MQLLRTSSDFVELQGFEASISTEFERQDLFCWAVLLMCGWSKLVPVTASHCYHHRPHHDGNTPCPLQTFQGIKTLIITYWLVLCFGMSVAFFSCLTMATYS